MHLGESAPEGGLEPLAIERLEQVIDRMNIESLEGKLVVGGDENDGGPFRLGESLNDLEPIHFGHLDIQKNQLGAEAGDGVESGAAVPRLADEVNGRFRAEEGTEAFPGEFLVIHDECSDLVHSQNFVPRSGRE